MRRKIVISALLIFAAVGVYLAFRYYCPVRVSGAGYPKWVDLSKRRAAWDAMKIKVAREVSSFAGQPGIVIKDLSTGWEASFNKDKAFPSASLVKIPVVLAAYKASHDGKFSMGDTIILRNRDRVDASKETAKLPNGSAVSIRELADWMITVSDNTASNMLIEFLGFNYLNKAFKSFGLKNTNIVRKMLDFRLRRKGVENYTTPADMAHILESIYRGRAVSRAASSECMDMLKHQKVNDRIPVLLPKGVVSAHKTGLERGVCHDAGIIFTKNGNILVCVLTKHRAKTSKHAKRFISKIAREVYDYSESEQ